MLDSKTMKLDETYIPMFLKDYPPFNALPTEILQEISQASQIQEHKAGTIILDGKTEARDRLWVVVQGKVGLWNYTNLEFDDIIEGVIDPDEEVVQGGIFGYTVVLYGSRCGPRSVALTDVQLIRIPGKFARPIFASPAGSAYLAKEVAVNARVKSVLRHDKDFLPATAAEMIRRKPTTGTASMTIEQAAQLMTAENSQYIAITDVPLEHNETGMFLLTDEIIRSAVVAQGRDIYAPVSIIRTQSHFVRSDAPAADVLSLMLENNLLYLPVLSNNDRLLGVIHARDYQGSPTNSSFQLRRRIEAASEVELVQLGSQIKTLIQNLYNQHAPIRHLTAAISVLYDSLERRAMTLTLQNSDLCGDEFVWFSLGSIARREASLSSDIDSATIIYPTSDESELKLEVLKFAAEVHALLACCGVPSDTNGAVASNPAFTRTSEEWRELGKTWLKDLFVDDAMMKASLCIDSRAVWGDLRSEPIREEFSIVSQHKPTLKLFLDEALSYKAKIRSIRDVLSMRGSMFDIKQHGLVPVVNIARWFAIWGNSREINTIARLNIAEDRGYIDSDTSSILIEAFDNLTRIRLSQQIQAHEEGLPITNQIYFRKLSPIDRSTVAQSVREISAVQRKLSNIAAYTDLEGI